MLRKLSIAALIVSSCSVSQAVGQGRGQGQGRSQSQSYGQGQSNRDAAGAAAGNQEAAQQRVQLQVNQRAQEQQERRLADTGNRVAERQAASAVEHAAHAAARRSASAAAVQGQDIRQFAASRGVRPDVVASKAAEHADLHAIIAAGLITGQPLNFSGEQRQKLKDVFGDAGLLEPQATSQSLAEVRLNGKSEERGRAQQSEIPLVRGDQGNVHAKLANAIRVRRTQISELRDQALVSGAPQLLDRADQLEKTLDIFLQNQLRVQNQLAQADELNRSLIK